MLSKDYLKVRPIFAGAVQKIIASILFISFLGQTFNQGLFYLDYLVEKKEYMKHCVNKDRPKMHCNGKCQMMKKMQEQEKKEHGEAPEMKLAAKPDIVFSRFSTLVLTPPAPEEASVNYFSYNSGTPVDRPSFIFHPPAADLIS